MRQLMNYIWGIVIVRVTAPFPERLINLCAQANIDFWAVEWLDDHTVRFVTRRHTMAQLEEQVRRAGGEAELESSKGLPDFLARFRTRYTFLAGLLLALCAVGVLSRFVLTIEVTGNERVPTAVILSQLRQLGVRPGVYGPSLDRKALAQEALLGLEELSWMGINLYGTRLEVIVREVLQTPERVDESGCFDLIAEADGVITHVEAEQGDALVQEGDIVVKGDILISGVVTMEPPQYSGLPDRYYQTHARGRVWARTWRELSAAIPLSATVKEYTGAQKSAWSLILFGQRIEIFGSTSISWPMYDKITTVHQAVLPGGGTLPASICRETVRAYETGSVPVDAAAAQQLLEEQLLVQLEKQIGEDGQVESTTFSARVDGDCLTVTVTAQCLEEIGREVPGAEIVPQELDAS